ncbi:fatty acyl-CoA reductase wat-like [Aricia agestis]|uniref:fatty acyl-CoA reductase wat-like n=1 Tax=Aricia agestis TaxID=91739 RepID=UPI001C20A839|nr:fatty acyl-CoA reductase wat-like [Aricia agestis]
MSVQDSISRETSERMSAWIEAQRRGEHLDVDVYGQPTPQQLQELDNVRKLSKELQDNLHELENTVRNPDADNDEMNPTAPILDYSEDHEFVSANQLDDYYATEDAADAKEEEKRKLMKGKAAKTEIQKFYKDQCVFLTGGTGFLGKVLIEKLLRSCGDLDTIYVLVRPKKGKDPQSRINDLSNDLLYKRAREENPNCFKKVVPIIGEMESPRLGMSDADWRLLTSRVSIIINSAATVKFDEQLSVAVGINIKGPKTILELAKECRNLKALTHVSTAFSNTQVKYIEEKFYDVHMSAETIEALADLDNKILEPILPTILGEKPNTYSLTKSIAEDVIRVRGEGMPVCIIRPSIVISTYEEPLRGWTDSLYGPTGLVVGSGTGVLRTMYISTDKVADMVPVDLTVNAIIASTWHTAKNFRENQTSDIPIYNYVSGAQNPITWGKFFEANERRGLSIPTINAVWYYGMTFTKCYYMFLFYNFFLHYLPALLLDTICLLTGKKRKFLKLYSRVIKVASILFYYSMRDWQFSDRNVQEMWRALPKNDQVVFPFSMAEFSWDHMIETFLFGLRVYLLKDDPSTLPEARIKWNRLYIAHQLLKLVTLGVVLIIGYYVFKGLFW